MPLERYGITLWEIMTHALPPYVTTHTVDIPLPVVRGGICLDFAGFVARTEDLDGGALYVASYVWCVEPNEVGLVAIDPINLVSTALHRPHQLDHLNTP